MQCKHGARSLSDLTCSHHSMHVCSGGCSEALTDGDALVPNELFQVDVFVLISIRVVYGGGHALDSQLEEARTGGLVNSSSEDGSGAQGCWLKHVCIPPGAMFAYMCYNTQQLAYLLDVAPIPHAITGPEDVNALVFQLALDVFLAQHPVHLACGCLV